MCAFNPSMQVIKTEKLRDYGQFTLMSLCPHIHAYVCMWIYTYMSICKCLYMCIYMFRYMYMYQYIVHNIFLNFQFYFLKIMCTHTHMRTHTYGGWGESLFFGMANSIKGSAQKWKIQSSKTHLGGMIPALFYDVIYTTILFQSNN